MIGGVVDHPDCRCERDLDPRSALVRITRIQPDCTVHAVQPMGFTVPEEPEKEAPGKVDAVNLRDFSTEDLKALDHALAHVEVDQSLVHRMMRMRRLIEPILKERLDSPMEPPEGITEREHWLLSTAAGELGGAEYKRIRELLDEACPPKKGDEWPAGLLRRLAVAIREKGETGERWTRIWELVDQAETLLGIEKAEERKFSHWRCKDCGGIGRDSQEHRCPASEPRRGKLVGIEDPEKRPCVHCNEPRSAHVPGTDGIEGRLLAYICSRGGTHYMPWIGDKNTEGE